MKKFLGYTLLLFPALLCVAFEVYMHGWIWLLVIPIVALMLGMVILGLKLL